VSTFEQDLAAFRKHARLMRKLGFCHVSAKASANREFHLEGPPPADLEAVGHPIGFHSEEDGEE
jgi:hypothetical protein